jgi:ABC-type proline/glycine betaine transport system permease subunit
MGMWDDMMQSMGFIIVATIMAISFWNTPRRLDGKI